MIRRAWYISASIRGGGRRCGGIHFFDGCSLWVAMAEWINECQQIIRPNGVYNRTLGSSMDRRTCDFRRSSHPSCHSLRNVIADGWKEDDCVAEVVVQRRRLSNL